MPDPTGPRDTSQPQQLRAASNELAVFEHRDVTRAQIGGAAVGPTPEIAVELSALNERIPRTEQSTGAFHMRFALIKTGADDHQPRAAW